MSGGKNIDWSAGRDLGSLKVVFVQFVGLNMFAKRYLPSGFRAIAATAVIAGAVMNLAAFVAEHASRMNVATPF